MLKLNNQKIFFQHIYLLQRLNCIFVVSIVADSTCDLTIDPDMSQYVLWGIGGIEETAFKHFVRTESMHIKTVIFAIIILIN